MRPRVGLPAGAPLDAAALLYDGAVAVTLGQASPAELRGLRRVPVLRARRHPAGRPADSRRRGRRSTSRSRSARTCGRTAGRSPSPGTAGAGLLVVPNASPYERGKDDTRLELCQRRAREAGAVLAYANMVGGQDELVFDGDSIIVDARASCWPGARSSTRR